MNSILHVLTLLILAWPSMSLAQQPSHIGTWELRKVEMTKREGQQYPVHRLILTADGRYLNSATIGGPRSIRYQLKKDEGNIGWYSFLIETPDDQKFGRGAGLRVDKRGLIMTYFDGRVLTYTRLSDGADEALLAKVPDKKITIIPNNDPAEQAAP